MTKASISIFSKKVENFDSSSSPETPSEVFEVAQKFAKNKSGCELIRSKSGLYVVAYSETGPGKSSVGWDNWLPVYVAKVTQWTSGGIQQKEMNDFLKEKKNEE